MNLAQAKKLAEARGYSFYWRSNERMYTCYPTDLSQEATYHTKGTLADITPERFEEVYLKINWS